MSFEPNTREKGKLAFLEEYQEKRYSATEDLTAEMYNTVIGISIISGLLINMVMAYNFTDAILGIPYAAIIIMYFALSLGGTFVVHKSDSPIISGAGYLTLVIGMGLMLTFFLTQYTMSTVYMAFAVTAGITLVMTILGTLFPDVFLNMRKMLGTALIVTIIAEIICAIFFSQAMGVFDYLVIAIFFGFIGYDWARAQKYPKTLNNAIDAAADLYVDIVNIMIRVLRNIGRSKNHF